MKSRVKKTIVATVLSAALFVAGASVSLVTRSHAAEQGLVLGETVNPIEGDSQTTDFLDQDPPAGSLVVEGSQEGGLVVETPDGNLDGDLVIEGSQEGGLVVETPDGDLVAEGSQEGSLQIEGEAELILQSGALAESAELQGDGYWGVRTYRQLIDVAKDDNNAVDGVIKVRFLNDIATIEPKVGGPTTGSDQIAYDHLKEMVLYGQDMIVDGNGYTFTQTAGSWKGGGALENMYGAFMPKVEVRTSETNPLKLTIKNMNIDIASNSVGIAFGADDYVFPGGSTPLAPGQGNLLVYFEDITAHGPQLAILLGQKTQAFLAGKVDITLAEPSDWVTVFYGPNRVEVGIARDHSGENVPGEVFEVGQGVTVQAGADVAIRKDFGTHAIFRLRRNDVFFKVEDNARLVIDSPSHPLFAKEHDNKNFHEYITSLDIGDGAYVSFDGSEFGQPYEYGEQRQDSARVRFINVGTDATFIVNARSSLNHLHVYYGAMNVAKDAIVILNYNQPAERALSLIHSSLTVTDPKFFALGGHLFHGVYNEGTTWFGGVAKDKVPLEITAQVVNLWDANANGEPTRIASENNGLIRIYQNMGSNVFHNRNYLPLDCKEYANFWPTKDIDYHYDLPSGGKDPAHRHNFRAVYGQHNLTMPEEINVYVKAFDGATTPGALIETTFTPNDDNQPATMTLSGSADASGGYTVRPETSGWSIPASQGPFKESTQVKLASKIPAPAPVVDFFLWLTAQADVTDLGRLSLTVPDLNYGVVPYAAYTKRYPIVNSDARITITDTRPDKALPGTPPSQFKFMLTAVGTPLTTQNATLAKSSIGYVTDGGAYHPIINNRNIPVKILDSNSQLLTNSGNTYTYDLTPHSMGSNQFVLQIDSEDHRQIVTGSKYLSEITWTLSPEIS